MLGSVMKLWRRTLLLAFLLANCTSKQERSSQTQGQKLRCYKCYSPESWSNCRENLTAVECTRQGDICYKIKRTRWVRSETEKLEVSYAMGCNVPETCSGEECKEHEWHCDLSCCNTDFCNGTVRMPGTLFFIIASLRFSFEFIIYF